VRLRRLKGGGTKSTLFLEMDRWRGRSVRARLFCTEPPRVKKFKAKLHSGWGRSMQQCAYTRGEEIRTVRPKNNICDPVPLFPSSHCLLNT
jgi:hypothetical protein